MASPFPPIPTPDNTLAGIQATVVALKRAMDILTLGVGSASTQSALTNAASGATRISSVAAQTLAAARSSARLHNGFVTGAGEQNVTVTMRAGATAALFATYSGGLAGAEATGLLNILVEGEVLISTPVYCAEVVPAGGQFILLPTTLLCMYTSPSAAPVNFAVSGTFGGVYALSVMELATS